MPLWKSCQDFVLLDITYSTCTSATIQMIILFLVFCSQIFTSFYIILNVKFTAISWLGRHKREKKSFEHVENRVSKESDWEIAS